MSQPDHSASRSGPGASQPDRSSARPDRSSARPDRGPRVGIVGLGLIGGSFAKAFFGADVETYVWNRNRETLEFALIESATGELDEAALASLDLLILATYPAHVIRWAEEHALRIDPSTIVIDACGTKRVVCEALWPVARECGFPFVGAHPMAGTEHSGFAYARADLFRGAPMVLCPDPALEDLERLELLDRLIALLEPVGFGSYTAASPADHDRIIAYTSQLAHVVSNAYVKSPRALSQLGFSAGSWQDLTRVARLNPTMWCELFLDDGDNLADEIDILIGHLAEYRDAIRDRDAERLTRLLTDGDRLKREADSR